MGISGLLPFLKKASKKSHVRNFSGNTVAVDAYCWLHKGAFGCAEKLGKGEPTTAYVTYCLKYLNVLRENGLKPILVFDGRNLPSKAMTEKKRRAKREENRAQAKKALLVGNRKEAWECFTRSIDITPSMARDLIKELRREKLDYIIAPYEADAQLAYLARKGIVDLVVTEDSDLVLFGCPRVFFKMSINGDGVFFDQSRIHLCMDQSAEKFQFDKFRQMCILSGCDYLASIPGIGLGRAKQIVTMCTNPDIEKVVKQIPSIIKKDVSVPKDYVAEFKRAENTFLYQLVFDPLTRTLVPLTPYLPGVDIAELTYCGKYEQKPLALDMALGNIDFKTLERVEDFYPEDPKWGYTEKSMWSKKYQIRPRQNPTADMKKNTKHTSTAGKKIIISGPLVLLKKRSIRCVETTTDTDEDILALYKRDPVETIVETHDTEIKKTPTVTTKTSRISAYKRVCLKSVYDRENTSSVDEFEGERGGCMSPNQAAASSKRCLLPPLGSGNNEDASSSHSSESRTTRSKNPFLKSPQLTTATNGIRSSVVLKITPDPDRKDAESAIAHEKVPFNSKKKLNSNASGSSKVTVKSKYFRNGTQTFLGGGLRLRSRSLQQRDP